MKSSVLFLQTETYRSEMKNGVRFSAENSPRNVYTLITAIFSLLRSVMMRNGKSYVLKLLFFFKTIQFVDCERTLLGINFQVFELKICVHFLPFNPIIYLYYDLIQIVRNS